MVKAQTTFVLAQGFGLEFSFWERLIPYFEGANVYDFASFSMQHCSTSYLVGVGHSLGLIKLLRSPYPWTHLFGLNGFIDFLFGSRLRHLEWRQFCRSIEQAPFEALRRFYDRAGLRDLACPTDLNISVLNEDLKTLIMPVLLKDIPITVIGTKDDLITPWHVLEPQFRETHVQLKCFETGQHALGYDYAAEIADIIFEELSLCR